MDGRWRSVGSPVDVNAIFKVLLRVNEYIQELFAEIRG